MRCSVVAVVRLECGMFVCLGMLRDCGVDRDHGLFGTSVPAAIVRTFTV